MPRRKPNELTTLKLKPDNSFIEYRLSKTDDEALMDYKGFYEDFYFYIWTIVDESDDKRIPPNYGIVLKFRESNSYENPHKEDPSIYIGHVEKVKESNYLRISISLPRRNFGYIYDAIINNRVSTNIQIRMTRLKHNFAAVESIHI